MRHRRSRKIVLALVLVGLQVGLTGCAAQIMAIAGILSGIGMIVGGAAHLQSASQRPPPPPRPPPLPPPPGGGEGAPQQFPPLPPGGGEGAPQQFPPLPPGTGGGPKSQPPYWNPNGTYTPPQGTAGPAGWPQLPDGSYLPPRAAVPPGLEDVVIVGQMRARPASPPVYAGGDPYDNP
jgi:hypothetical protein